MLGRNILGRKMGRKTLKGYYDFKDYFSLVGFVIIHVFALPAKSPKFQNWRELITLISIIIILKIIFPWLALW